MSNKLDGIVPPETLAKIRHALSHDTSGTVPAMMRKSGISMDRAIDQLFNLAYRGVVRLLLQPNGECLIDYLLSPQESNEVIVDAEVNRIMKGSTTLERPPVEIITGKTTVEIGRKKLN